MMLCLVSLRVDSALVCSVMCRVCLVSCLCLCARGLALIHYIWVLALPSLCSAQVWLCVVSFRVESALVCLGDVSCLLR